MDFWNVGLLSDDGFKSDPDLWPEDYEFLEEVWDELDDDDIDLLSDGWWSGLI